MLGVFFPWIIEHLPVSFQNILIPVSKPHIPTAVKVYKDLPSR